MAKKYRNELKYLIHSHDVQIIEDKLKHVMDRDPYADKETGSYVVRSLYFDSYDDDCLHNNEFSLGRRKKFRIRMYGDDQSLILLEKKEKENNMSQKTSYRLSKEEYNQLFYGDVSEMYWQTKDPLLKEFCLEVMSRLFRPKVIVHYERKPFVYFTGNVRVTLDMNISCSTELPRFVDNNYLVIPTLEQGEHLLEVKYDELLPDFLKQIIQLDTLEQATFSKYYISRITSQEHGGL